MSANSFKDMNKQLGKNLQRFREKKELSQEALAEKLEISRTYLAYIETGSRAPSLKVLHKIAAVLDVKIEELFKF